MRLQLFVVDDCSGHEKQPQNGNYEKHRKDRKKDLRVRFRISESCSVGRLVSVAKIVCLWTYPNSWPTGEGSDIAALIS